MADIKGAGICLVAPDGSALFIKRSPDANHANEWDFPGGRADDYESPEDTARRETYEEIGFVADGPLAPFFHQKDKENVEFLTYKMPVAHKFCPALQQEEHTDYVWAPFNNPPEPLHPGVRDAIDNMKTAMDHRLAFDRSSVRTFDEDGRMHVALTHISKANVCPYKGSEIPDAEELGLDLDKVYQLLRDPKELEKAAPTFNNLPLLNDHVAVSAYDHKPEMTVGSTGTDAVFNAPYLDNSLVIWAADAIAGIESGDQKELSCAYRYRADMTPGTYEGTPYDGVMRDIRGNHVALVPAGRAGPDVVVGDSKLKEVSSMKKKPLSSKAMLVKGALMAYLPGKLATDAKPNLDMLLAHVAADNWRQFKPTIAAALKPMLAKDADLDGFHKLLDSMDQPGKSDHDLSKDDEGKINGVAEDDEYGAHEPILSLLRGKVSDELLAKIAQMLQEEEKNEMEQPAMDDDNPQAAKSTQSPQQRALATEKQDQPAMDRKAFDAAIEAAAKNAEKKAIDRMNKIAEAKAEVRPYVGEVLGMDSAKAVYKYALETLGVNVDGVDPSAYKHILKAQPKPGQTIPSFAMDSAGIKGFHERFPGAAKIRVIH